MKKLFLLVLILPFVSWAQVDSLGLKKEKPIVLKTSSTPEIPNPLIVVDGKIVDYDKTIKELNPDEIDSIKVLKDKTAVEKYGAAGKDGVLEIFTKTRKKD